MASARAQTLEPRLNERVTKSGRFLLTGNRKTGDIVKKYYFGPDHLGG